MYPTRPNDSILMCLALSTILMLATSTVPCANLSHWNPNTNQCQLNNNIYYIQELEKPGENYWDWKVLMNAPNSSDIRTLRIAPGDFQDEILTAYSLQCSIFENSMHQTQARDYHLRQYFDRPNVISKNTPTPIIMEHYDFADLNQFIDYMTQQLKDNAEFEKEYFAIHSWCRLTKQISIALQFVFNEFQRTFKEFNADKIYIRDLGSNFMFSYFLDGLEETVDLTKYLIDLPSFDSEYSEVHKLFITKGIIGNLISLGFEFYAKLCSEHALFKLDSRVPTHDGMSRSNFFCSTIKSFVNDTEVNDKIHIQKKTLQKKSMLRQLIQFVSAKNGTTLVGKLMEKTAEYHLTKLIANYGVLNLDISKDFTRFNQDLDGVCQHFYDIPQYFVYQSYHE